MYCSRLELVNDTHGRPVVSGDTSRFGVIVVVQLVEFIRSVDVHVLVKVVPVPTSMYLTRSASPPEKPARDCRSFAFGLYVADGRTQAEVKLILYNCFKVLSFTSEVVIFFRSHVVSLGVHDGRIDVVSVIFCRGRPCFGFVAIAVSFLIHATVRAGVACRQCDTVVERVGGCGAEAVAILLANRTVVVVLPRYCSAKLRPSTRPKKSELR